VSAPTVRELQPGEYEVALADRRCRVLVPAGVGVPGLLEEDLVGAVARWYVRRGEPLPATVDVSALLGCAPGLADELAELAEDG
jgi:hypothetical protein